MVRLHRTAKARPAAGTEQAAAGNRRARKFSRMALESVSALILDDNAHMRGLLRAILTNFGMRQIEEAEGFDDAVRVLAGGEVDLAFVDIKLEGPDGIEFCRHVRRTPGGYTRFLPLVIVTAYSERSRVIEAVNTGADEFLVKPVRPVDVANRVNAVIERRRPFIDIPAYFGPDRRRRVDPRFTGPWRRSDDPGTVDI
jgi:DNA-binding response OmpR family regulator